MKPSTLSHASTGNAVMISIAITTFLFLAAAGASKVIMTSLRDSSKVVDTGKAIYSAEGALESALYEAAGRTSGYERTAGTAAGDDAFVAMNRINSSEGSWDASSGSERARNRTTGDPGNDTDPRILFIPPRQSTDDNFNLGDWKKVTMGQPVAFNLYVDTSGYSQPVPLGIPAGSTAPAANTPPPSGTTDIIGPNGVPASATKSIFGEGQGTDQGAPVPLAEVFIDLFLPVADLPDRQDNPILLSWKVEGVTPSTIEAERVITMTSAAQCGDATLGTDRAGVICYDHLYDQGGAFNGISLNLENNGSTPIGRWVRITNPAGLLPKLISGLDNGIDTGKNIKDFFSKNSTSLYGKNIFFPRIVLQLGPKISGTAANSTTSMNISEAYIRVGFRLNQNESDITNVINSFPLPDDKIRINAVGKSGTIKQGINAEINPQELAPMFDYTVFQP